MADNTHCCIIHCTEDESDLKALRDIASWETLLNAANIPLFKPVLEYEDSLEPKLFYKTNVGNCLQCNVNWKKSRYYPKNLWKFVTVSG